ncbi:2-dehydro-3-deoxyphosphooctonate aldolase [Corallincola holothuriorum]|uniref:2-dehydro-3-deoxyphosphooctonate aldolase n=1 Tax=Corallincola holothuriorum TaxID=2282215 RepID=A0A368NQ82_9GAMM|nr:murein L,D-transpeptidase family protein [Corallincola holothuriorum]RCU52702.1 2-dehydro-3-deoxyphosphooctonate aldolase [Corallincola holothuriorum]
MKFKWITWATMLCSFVPCLWAVELPTSARSETAIAQVEPALKKALAAKGLKYGAPIFIRIFKTPGVLELWLESASGEFKHFKSYDICDFSGDLGPKVKEGDYQSPEGFYFVNAGRLNPWSQFHLSFNLGYPNRYDRYHGRTGSALMVHGNCVSIGCYAMTDSYINEIYALAVAALRSGQPYFRVHAFPFELENDALAKYRDNQWYEFWQNLKQGYDYFNEHKRPPNVEVSNGIYTFGA